MGDYKSQQIMDDAARQVLVDEFINALKKAAKNISDEYFEVKFCDPSIESVLMFRERVYCYELYHQLRVELGTNYPYKLHGEMDKKSHDTYDESPIKNVVPDFIVHDPGTLDNLLVMEVKHENSKVSFIEKDFDKLRQFKEVAGYHTAISYIFGKLDKEQEERLIKERGEGIILILHREQNKDIVIL